MLYRLRCLVFLGVFLLIPSMVYATNPPTLCPDGSQLVQPQNTDPVPSCPLPGGLASDFIIPSACVSKDEQNACSVNGFAFPLDDEPKGGFTNNMYGITGANGQRYAVQVSSDKSLVYQLRGDGVYFLQDTTFSNSPKTDCTDGNAAFQRIYDTSGNPGARTLPSAISCGSTYSLNGSNRAFRYLPSGIARPPSPDRAAITQRESELRPFPPDATQNICAGRAGIGQIGSDSQVIYTGPAKCGSFSGDTMVTYNKGGAGKGETFIYCKGFGLCGWYEEIDWTNKKAQPASWKADTDLCAGFPSNKPFCQTLCNTNNPQKQITIGQQVAASIIAGLSNGATRDVDVLAQVDPGEDKHRITDYTPAAIALSNIARYLTPGASYSLDLNLLFGNSSYPGGKTIIEKNKDPTSVTTRFAISQKDTNQSPGNQFPVGTSIEHLNNVPKDKPSSDLGDAIYVNFAYMGSALFPADSDRKKDLNPVLTTNTNELPLTRPDQKLKEKIVPPADSIPAVSPPKLQELPPNGENIFYDGTTTNPVVSLVARVSQSLIDSAIDILKRLSGQGGVTIAAGATLNSCSQTANEDLLHIKTITNMRILTSAEVINKNMQKTKDGRTTNKYDMLGQAGQDQDHNEYGANLNNIMICDGFRSHIPAELLQTKLKDKVPGCRQIVYPRTDNLCQVPDPNHMNDATSPGGYHHPVSDGVIALALKVSQYTCTPAELLIAMLAKEVDDGMTYTAPGQQVLITGDPNQQICRTERCTDSLGGPVTSTSCSLGCGPYSMGLTNYRNVFNHKDNSAIVQNCIARLNLSGSPDPRLLGQSMCVQAANMWRSFISAGFPACTGANQKAYTLQDVSSNPQGVELAIMGFIGCGPGDTRPECMQGGQPVYGPYRNEYISMLDGHKAAVDRIRGICPATP